MLDVSEIDASEWDDAWETSERLPIWGAAYLIVGVRPLRLEKRNSILDATLNGKLNEIILLLSTGFMTGEFPPDPANVRERNGQYETSVVTREALRAFMTARGECPAFLLPTKDTERHAGGRPLRLEIWIPWVVELVSHFHERGFPEGQGQEGQGKIVSDVARAMTERGFGDVPTESTAKKVVQAVLNRLRSQ